MFRIYVAATYNVSILYEVGYYNPNWVQFFYTSKRNAYPYIIHSFSLFQSVMSQRLFHGSGLDFITVGFHAPLLFAVVCQSFSLSVFLLSLRSSALFRELRSRKRKTRKS